MEGVNENPSGKNGLFLFAFSWETWGSDMTNAPIRFEAWDGNIPFFLPNKSPEINLPRAQ